MTDSKFSSFFFQQNFQNSSSIRYAILAMLVITSLASCEKNIENPEVYVSGKIVNPTGDYMILRDYDQLSDSIVLDGQGRFKFEISDIAAGFFTIEHPAEYQTIYLSPGDSLSLRLNTRAFDESLAFTGTHAGENNFLIQEFVTIEERDRKLMASYQLEPMDFYNFIDSLQQDRIMNLEQIAQERGYDQDFVALLKKTYEYNSWSRLERYAIAHYGKNEILESTRIPSLFYVHRKNHEINDLALLNHYTFRPYIRSLVSNQALINCARKHGSGKKVDRSSYEYAREKLNVIRKLFTNQSMIEFFAQDEIRNSIRTRKNATEIYDLLADFSRVSSNQKLNNDITAFASQYIKLEAGNKVPNITLITHEQEEIKLKEVVSNLTIVYFWSTQQADYMNRVHKVVDELRIKYPEIKYLGINVDLPSSEYKNLLQKSNFLITEEFQIKNTKAVIEALALRGKNRSMVLNGKLQIIDPDINLFHYQIETTLLGYLNR
ncbi:MAG: hypothetical protein WBA16_10190 [Nonlabens sp.]